MKVGALGMIFKKMEKSLGDWRLEEEMKLPKP